MARHNPSAKSSLPATPGTQRHADAHALFCRRAGFSRRAGLQAAGLTGLSWLTPLGHLLAQQAAERDPAQAQSLILLWMGGGPSQLETFDPHPGTLIGGGTRAINTSLRGVQLAEHLPQLAEQMAHITLVRSLVSREGDHERGTYNIKTGYRPDPTAIHPSIGAILCHELPAQCADLPFATDIPRHVSILPGQWPGRGGLLGDQYDAFKTYDPIGGVPDVRPRVTDERMTNRLADLNVIEGAFGRPRQRRAEATLHGRTVAEARTMMTSEQLQAFSLQSESAELKARYGDTPFGRGCLAARRLIERGVRCVEVTLNGWDSHADNARIQRENAAILDPAFAALLRDLQERNLLRRTIVMCVGEFGRTPRVNPLEGRDHWPHGFSLALAGGGLRAGYVHGQTDPEGGREVANPVAIGDVYATLLTQFGVDYRKINISRVQRPIALAEGQPLPVLLGESART